MLGNNLNFDISWEIDAALTEKEQEELENNIDLFRLNEVYQYHKEEIRLMLKRREMVASKKYVSAVKEMVGEEDLEEILWGTTMNPEKFGEKIMAKVKYDAVVRN